MNNVIIDIKENQNCITEIKMKPFSFKSNLSHVELDTL